MSNLHNAPDGREPLNLANRQPDAAATPFLQAVHRYRADMLEARRLSATDDGDDVLSEAEDRFHASTEAVLPFRHLPDALAAVEWVRADLAEGQCGNRSDWPSDVRQRDTLLNGVGDFLRMAAETGDQALSSPALKTTIIPAVGPTIWEAAHPDAALFAAWDGLKKSYRAFTHARDVLLPDGGTDKDHEPYYETMEIHERQIRQHEASTVEGFAIQLRYLFAMRMESLNSFMVALYGDPLERELVAELDEDYRDKMLWSMAQAAARASARDHWKDEEGQRPADTNAPPPPGDAFANAVTAFRDEASATLALPQRPTGGMVEAGASAAGITPQQFQAAYAAAMAAFQQERAA